MSELNIFEYATRNALRFPSEKGQLSLTVEDLWNLPLKSDRNVSLDSVAKNTHKQIAEATTESFVDDAPKVSKELTIRMDIIKHIISVRKDENAKKEDQKQKAELRQKLLAIKAQRQESQLLSMDDAQLDELLASLN